MGRPQVWTEVFQIPPLKIQTWQSQLPSGQALLPWCLLQGHLPESKYFPWAMTAFGLPKVKTEFFNVPTDMIFWDLVKSLHQWSPSLLPLAEWQGMLMIGCVEPPERLMLPMPHHFVLASAHDLQGLWDRIHARTSGVSNTTSTAHPADDVVNGSGESEGPEGLSALEDFATPQAAPSFEMPEGFSSAFTPAAFDEQTQFDHVSFGDSTHEGSHGDPADSQEAAGESDLENEKLEGLNFDSSKAASIDFSSLFAPAGETAPVTDAPPSTGIESGTGSITQNLFEKNVVVDNALIKEAIAKGFVTETVVTDSPASGTSVASSRAPAYVPPPVPANSKTAPVTPPAAKAAPARTATPITEQPTRWNIAAPTPSSSTDGDGMGTRTAFTLMDEAQKTRTTIPSPLPSAEPLKTAPAPAPTPARQVSARGTSPGAGSPSPDRSMTSFISQVASAHSQSNLKGLVQKPLSASQSYEELALQSLLRIEGIFQSGMILMFQGGKLRPWKWTDLILSVRGDSTEPIPLEEASIFRIVLRTCLPYHGYVVTNPINSAFFNDFNRGKIPAHVTVMPILIDRQVAGMLVGLTDLEINYKSSLTRMQNLTSDVAVELKRLRELKAA